MFDFIHFRYIYMFMFSTMSPVIKKSRSCMRRFSVARENLHLRFTIILFINTLTIVPKIHIHFKKPTLNLNFLLFYDYFIIYFLYSEHSVSSSSIFLSKVSIFYLLSFIKFFWSENQKRSGIKFLIM